MSLLEALQGLLERTYAMRSGVQDIGRFVIGDAGLELLYGSQPQARRVDSNGGGARTLLREVEGSVRACIYYPDALVARLERHPPQRGVHRRNIDAFATLVEELDHLLLVGERTGQNRPLSLFELELHANVSKFLVGLRFVRGSSGRVDQARRLWLRHHLFDKAVYSDADPQVRQRYRDAARWAVQFLEALPRISPRRRLATLRRFHAADAGGKLRLIRRLAA